MISFILRIPHISLHTILSLSLWCEPSCNDEELFVNIYNNNVTVLDLPQLDARIDIQATDTYYTSIILSFLKWTEDMP